MFLCDSSFLRSYIFLSIHFSLTKSLNQNWKHLRDSGFFKTFVESLEIHQFIMWKTARLSETILLEKWKSDNYQILITTVGVSGLSFVLRSFEKCLLNFLLRKVLSAFEACLQRTDFHGAFQVWIIKNEYIQICQHSFNFPNKYCKERLLIYV